MPALWFDTATDDSTRRERIFAGDVFVFSPRATTIAFTDFARSLIEDAFFPLDPREAQHTLPGLTRFGLDFRTVHLDDVTTQRGAPNIDSERTGISLRDFMRGTDLEPLPEPAIAPYDGEHPPGGVLVFRP